MTTPLRSQPQRGSRAIWLREDHRREIACNTNTVCLAGSVEAIGPWIFHQRFVAHYQPIRELIALCPRPGLAVLAIDHAGVAAAGYLAAKPGAINVGVIGRHELADLFLDGDPALSLRHLMVILHASDPRGGPRLRLLDLRTTVAFKDERGAQLQALEAEGQALVSCGRYTLFFFAVEPEEVWPEQADAAWACLPERIYFDEVRAEPDRWARQRVKGARPLRPEQPVVLFEAGRRRSTLLRSVCGPELARQQLLAPDEEVVGELRISDGVREGGIRLGASALRAGVLIGREPRCDGGGLPAVLDRTISRVHLLVIEIAGTIYAIDVASTRGVRHRGRPVRLTRLDHGDAVELGDGAARVAWRTLS